MGAQRIKNIEDIQKISFEVSKDSNIENNNQEKLEETKEEVQSRLQYDYEKNLTEAAKKFEERTKRMDPLKAQQADRLGMGLANRRYVLNN